MTSHRLIDVGSVVVFCAAAWTAILLAVASFWRALGPVPCLLAALSIGAAIALGTLAILVKRELQRQFRWHQVRRASRRHAALRFRTRAQEAEEQREWRASWSPGGDY